jgi:hypothetical protein
MGVLSAFGFMVLLSLGSGSFSNDLVSLIETESYFKSRQVDVTAATMLEFAGKDPRDGKTQIGQLLAIRWLGEHPDEAKKDTKIRALLDEIAHGTKSQDPLGFARDYARSALALMDGKSANLFAIPENSVRTDSLKWFPANVSFVAAGDFRHAPDSPAPPKPAYYYFEKIMQAMPFGDAQEAKNEVYKFAEEVGNLRLDRLSFAFSPDPNQSENSRIYVRLTGRGNHQRLRSFIQKSMPKAAVKEEKAIKEGALSLIGAAGESPAFALVGNSDLLMCGYEGNHGNHLEVIQDVLDVLAGKRPSVVTGPVAAELKGIPPLASGFLLGEIPDEIRKDLGRGLPVKVLPASMVAHVTRGKEIVAHFQGKMASAEEAKALADSFSQMKQMGIAALKDPPPGIKITPKTAEKLTALLETLKVEAKDFTVTGGIKISAEAVQAIWELIESSLKF